MEEDKEQLLEAAHYKGIEVLDTLHLHHCTIQFGEDTLVPDNMIGQLFSICVVGIVSDDLANCFVVKKDFATDRVIPHITMSCKNNIPPAYSNMLLEHVNTIDFFDSPIYVLGTIEKKYSSM